MNNPLDVVVQQVHAPVFFSQLRDAGIVPANQKEASDLLDLARRIRHQVGQQKVAAAQTSRFSGLLSQLGGTDGFDRTTQVKRAADALATEAIADPAVLEAFRALDREVAAQQG